MSAASPQTGTRPQRRLVVLATYIGLILVSLLIGIVAFEIAGRFMFNPADYLSVTTVPDPVLGMTIKPDSPGFDSWGFRNAAVPDAVDIVAIGDSHTYGNTAKMHEAWPDVVARETGLTVYNMGLGGYGPNQYYQLMTTRAVSLKPKQVLIGLYMGDDFENAFSITYGLDHWKFLREGTRPAANADIWGDSEPSGPLKPLRNWLSSHSFAYRVVVHGPALAGIKANLQLHQVSDAADPSVTVLEAPENNIREAFRPIRIAAGLDQTRDEVREGMRITLHLLQEMQRTCKNNGCRLTVAIIPSKETVFSEYFQREPELHLKNVVQSLIQNERVATAVLEEHLQRSEIGYLNTLPALRNAVQNEIYYRGPADMHPNANGYRVIGLAIAEFLKAAPTSAAHH